MPKTRATGQLQIGMDQERQVLKVTEISAPDY